MTIQEQVTTILWADAGVTALVSTAKIKTPGDWQNLSRPYIIHRPVSADPFYTMDGLARLKCWPSYQIDCYADTYSSLTAVKDVVINALTGPHGESHFSWTDYREAPYESDVKVFMAMLDFEVYEAL